MQMFVLPAHGGLQNIMQIGDAACTRNAQSAPNGRADAAQANAQVVHYIGIIRAAHSRTLPLQHPGNSITCFSPRIGPLSYYEERYRQRVLHHLAQRAEKMGMKLVTHEQLA